MLDKLTQSAKTKYGVDLGGLYQIKYRNIEVGSYLTMGSSSAEVRSRLEANEAAFEAIDKSETQKVIDVKNELEQKRMQFERQVANEATQIASEGNYVVSEGQIQVPKDFPQIAIKCG